MKGRRTRFLSLSFSFIHPSVKKKSYIFSLLFSALLLLAEIRSGKFKPGQSIEFSLDISLHQKTTIFFFLLHFLAWLARSIKKNYIFVERGMQRCFQFFFFFCSFFWYRNYYVFEFEIQSYQIRKRIVIFIGIDFCQYGAAI